MSNELTRVDSAVAGVSFEEESPLKQRIPHSRRRSSDTSGVQNIKDLEKNGIELAVAPETLKLNWKLNTSPSTIDEKDWLKTYLVTPPVKRIDLHFPYGLTVTARNLKGVTIKDGLDAMYKQCKKKEDDELELPILKGFEWDKEECWTKLIVHQKARKDDGPSSTNEKGKKPKT